MYLPLSLSVGAVRSWKMAQMSAHHLLLRRLTAIVDVYEVWWKSLRERSVSLKSVVWLSDVLSYDGWIDSAICFGAVSMVTVMPLQLKWSCCRTFLNGMCLPPLWSHFPSKNTQCGSIQDFWGRGGRLWCIWWTANVVEYLSLEMLQERTQDEPDILSHPRYIRDVGSCLMYLVSS